MLSAEKEFNAILEQFGHSVLLLHQTTKVRCSCYDPLLQASDRDCPYCFGLGTVPLAEKHLTRDMDMRVPDTLPYISSMQLYGELAVGSRSYFFKKDVAVKEKDLIVEVDWVNGSPTYNGGYIFEVSHIDPQRFLNGEIVFQKVYVKDQPVQKSIRGIKIIEAYGNTRFQVAEGGN